MSNLKDSKTDEEWEELENKYLNDGYKKRSENVTERRELVSSIKFPFRRWFDSFHNWVRIFLKTARNKTK